MGKVPTLPVRVDVLREMRRNCQILTTVIQSSGHMPKAEKIRLHGINLKLKTALDGILQLELFSQAQFSDDTT